jgi:type I restriction enzyme R subunit
VTTSKLLNTGVDAQTCQLIVLDTIINSMTEFKQIIGRGTRVVEKKNKLYFTIMDFRNATRLFRDKDFDGRHDGQRHKDQQVGPPAVRWRSGGVNVGHVCQPIVDK